MFNVRNTDKRLRDKSFIDLFCGIGGFHLALSSYGAKCIFASDINVSASNVYYKNFGIQPKGDIKCIKNIDIPKHDILCAGFPCQSFSISGNQNGFSDENGKLFFEVYRIARYHHPKLIILENVKNLLSHNNGKTISVMEQRLKSIGYNIYNQVLCATDFSVPQARKRVYIVAFRNDLNVQNFQFPSSKGRLKVVSDVLDDNVEQKYFISKPYIINGDIENDQNKYDKLMRIGSVGLGRQGERIYSVRGQGITLSSQGGGIGGKTGMYYVDGRVRKLTPRECARMMGFPEKFKLANTDAECYKQFGNSVVVNVIQEIIGEASKYL